MKQPKETAMTNCQNQIDWAELYLDCHFKGQILVTKSGVKYFEGVLDGLKWSQANVYMATALSLCRRTFQLSESDLVLRMRFIEDKGGQMQPVLVVVGKKKCKDPAMLKALLADLVEQTVVQASLKFSDSNVQLTDEVRQLVDASAAEYLDNNSGQVVQRQMLLKVDDCEVATVRGVLKSGSARKAPEKKEFTVIGLYEGRLYRSHVLHIISKDSRARQYVIPYEVSKFEGFLIGLKENKNAVLKVVFLADDDGQSKPLELVSVELVETPVDLELN